MKWISDFLAHVCVGVFDERLQNVRIEAHLELVCLDGADLATCGRHDVLAVLLRHQLVDHLLRVLARLRNLRLATFDRLKNNQRTRYNRLSKRNPASAIDNTEHITKEVWRALRIEFQ